MSTLFFSDLRLELMKSTLLFGWLFLVSMGLQAQDTDTLSLAPVADTLLQQDTGSISARQHFFRWFSEDYPNPKKALILSAFPGGGQAYDKRWWKIPIVYGALGGMLYLVDRNSTEYLYYKRAYRRKVRGLPHDLSGQGGLDSPTVLKTYRDQADKNMQLSYIGLVAVYTLAGVEAFVDAHLKSFDVSDDLSIHWGPNDMGIGFTIQF